MIKQDSITVCELFSSIQGESSYAGLPCFFIRLAGCNLKCSYCDTAYAQNREGGKDYSIDELVKEAEKSGMTLVEITGGEPLLQKSVIPLCETLLNAGFTVLIETNGSCSIAELPDAVIKIIDCKSPSSGEADKMDFNNFSTLSCNVESRL